MGDAELVELVAPEGDLTARFAVGAGMVGYSLREGGEELLRIGEDLAAYLDHGAVFGIRCSTRGRTGSAAAAVALRIETR